MKKQLQRWGRDEVQISAEIPMEGTSGDFDSLFRFRQYPEFDMSAVKSTGAAHDWQTFTPATCRVATAELALMKHIAEEQGGDFLLVGQAWKATLVPQGCIVIARGAESTTAYFSLLPTTAGVLAWPCDRVGAAHVRLAGHGARPFWAPVFNLDEHYILPASVHSPLRSFLEGVPLQEVGILAAHDKPVKLVQYQSRRGFAGVPELSLKLLFAELGHEAPEQEPQSEVPQDVAWAAELINILTPDLEPTAVHGALMARVTVDQNICEPLLADVYSDEALQDCMRDQDKKAMRDIIQSSTKSSERRKKHSECIQKFVSNRFAKKKGAHKAAKGGAQKHAAKEVVLSEKGALRWWSNVKGDMAYIDKWRPSVGSCVKDQGNGRFLIAYPGRQRVSYSWTVRGVEAASVQVLKKLWEWHTEATGERCPLPL